MRIFSISNRSLTEFTTAYVIICCSIILLFSANLAAVDKPADIENAVRQAFKKKLDVEQLMTPVRTQGKNVTFLVPNADKKTYDILQLYFPRYWGPNEIVIIDTGTGEIKQVKQPRGMQWHMSAGVIAPNGKLYINTLGAPHLKQEVNVYDPVTNTLKIKAVKMPEPLSGETHPMVLGTDGKIYAGGRHAGTSQAGACQIDPDTDKVTYYGSMGPDHSSNGCWGYTCGSDDTHVYVASGKIPWYLVAYNKKNGKSETLLTTPKVGGYINISQTPSGCIAYYHEKDKSGNEKVSRKYWLVKGKAVLAQNKEKPPWKIRKPLVSLPPRPEVYTENATPGADGKAEIWMRYPEAKAKAYADKKAGKVFKKPEDAGWKKYAFTVDTFPERIYRVLELPDGRVFGTGGHSGGQFIYNPKTKKCTYLGKTPLSYYAQIVHEGKFYFSGYPNSCTYVYDPAKPWTRGVHQGNPLTPPLKNNSPKQNPLFLGYFSKKSGAHKMFAAASGADGCVYFGGRWYRNGAGGGLAWWDPKTKKLDGFSKIFSNYQIRYMTSASNGKYIIISTMPVGDPLYGKKKAKCGRIFIFDTETKKIVRTLDPVKEVLESGRVAGGAGPYVVGLTNTGRPKKKGGKRFTYIYCFNAETGKIIYKLKLNLPTAFNPGGNEEEGFDLRVGPNGYVWTFLNWTTLVKIDAEKGKFIPLGNTGESGYMAFSDKDIYLSSKENLRRVKNVLPEVKQK